MLKMTLRTAAACCLCMTLSAGMLSLAPLASAAHATGTPPLSGQAAEQPTSPPQSQIVTDPIIQKPSRGDADGAAIIYQPPRSKFSPGVKFARLQIAVIDGRTRQPLSGAEVAIPETGGRYRTGADGNTPYFDAPVIRNPRYEQATAELHGQLTGIAYKDGYHDSIHIGIRMHEGKETHTTVWMYKLQPGERIEPVLYQEPYHRLWTILLADRFRSPSQPGEGPERPD